MLTQQPQPHRRCPERNTHTSTDRTTEILNYLSAISRDVGALRAEVGELRAEVNRLSEQVVQLDARLERVKREQKRQGRRLERIEGLTQPMRADVDDLQDRVLELEGKQA